MKEAAEAGEGKVVEEEEVDDLVVEWKERGGWNELMLSEEMKIGLNQMGLHAPTDVQRTAIPAVMKGENVVFSSQTGTGKTLAFAVPVLELLTRDQRVFDTHARVRRPRALFLSPNRELCEQIFTVTRQLRHHVRHRGACLSDDNAIAKLKTGVDLVVATPGRLKRLLSKEQLFLSDVEYLVLDEADTLCLDGNGWWEELEESIAPLLARVADNSKHRKRCQVILASATMDSHSFRAMTSRFPDMHRVQDPRLHQLSRRLKQDFVTVGAKNKLELVLELLKQGMHKGRGSEGQVSMEYALVFCNTVKSCRALQYFLDDKGFPTAAYHAGLPPIMRKRSWESFQSGEFKVAVVSDLASRGLDTAAVRHIVNFDFPQTAVDYVHRVGRTARAGATGRVTSFVTARDRELAKLIQASGTHSPVEEAPPRSRRRMLRGRKSRQFSPNEKHADVQKARVRTLAARKARVKERSVHKAHRKLRKENRLRTRLNSIRK